MVLLTEDAGVATGPDITRPRSGRALTVRRSREAGAPREPPRFSMEHGYYSSV